MPLPLPRELRDTIYNYLWDEETVKSITLSLDPAPDNFPDCHETTTNTRRLLPTLPWFFKSRYLGHQTTKEIIESFYRFYPALEVKGPRYIKAILKHDFFDLNMRLCDARMSAFTVTIYIDPANMEHMDKGRLKYNLSMLLRYLPVLASDFTLTMRLRAKYDVHWFQCICTSKRHCPIRRKNSEVVENLACAFEVVSGFVGEFEAQRQRTVVVRLEFEGYAGLGCAEVEITREDFGNDEEMWLRRLRVLCSPE